MSTFSDYNEEMSCNGSKVAFADCSPNDISALPGRKSIKSVKMDAFVSDLQMAQIQCGLHSKRASTNTAFHEYQTKNGVESTTESRNKCTLRPLEVFSSQDHKNKNMQGVQHTSHGQRRNSDNITRSIEHSSQEGRRNSDQFLSFRNHRFDAAHNSNCTQSHKIRNRVRNSYSSLALNIKSEKKYLTTKIKDKFANASHKSQSINFLDNYYKNHKPESEFKETKGAGQHHSISNAIPYLKKSSSIPEMINDICADQMHKLRLEVTDSKYEKETKSNTAYINFEGIHEGSNLSKIDYRCTIPTSSINWDEGTICSLESVCF